MASKKAMPEMKPLIFALDYPAIIAIFVHPGLLWPNALIRAGGNQRRASLNIQDLNSRLELPIGTIRRPPSNYSALGAKAGNN